MLVSLVRFQPSAPYLLRSSELAFALTARSRSPAATPLRRSLAPDYVRANSRSLSLRARGRLRRLPSGARLLLTTFGRTRGRSHCALAAACGDSPPALVCS